MTEIPEGYKVEYEHRRNDRVVYQDNFIALESVIEVDPRGGTTIARILDSEGNVVAQGQAICSPKDNYNKAIGRQISLGRALKNYNYWLGIDNE